jgi:serine/threonine protein kinase
MAPSIVPDREGSLDRAGKIRQVLEGYGRRRAAGEEIPGEVLLAQYPDLLPELAEELRKLRLIENARQQALQDLLPGPGSTVDASEAAPPSGDDQLGTPVERPNIPDYDLLRPIGAGSFGVVWLARNRLDEHFFALKVVPKDRLIELEGIRLYRRSANDHPYIVPIAHVGEGEGFYYYVMPLADDIKGTAVLRSPEHYEPMTLERYLAGQGRLPLDEVHTVADHLLAALEHLHAGGVIHCDVKPGNIVRMQGTWRLGDLGLMAGGDQLQPNRGTRAFWPPEGPRDRTTDLYALGKTLYLLLTGAELDRFPEFADGTLKIPGDDPKAEGLRQVILRACHNDPACRFPSAGAMRQALARLRPRRKPWWLAAAALLVLASVAVWLGPSFRPPAKQTPSIDDGPRDPDGKLLRHDFPIKVELIGARKDPSGPLHRMTEGQLLSFRIEAPQNCYIGIWYENEEGKITQLFPNDHDPNYLIVAGKPRFIPGENDYIIPASRGNGPGRMRILASTERWDPIKGRKVGPFVVFATPEELEGLRNFEVQAKTKAVSENVFLMQVGPR